MHWHLKNPTPTQNIGAKEVLRLLLENRGVADGQQKDFLNPQVNSSQLSQLIAQVELEKAAGLIHQAIRQNRPIIIHGDYDVDGICATAILWETLSRHLNYSLARPFIPHRQRHGYGVTTASLEEVKRISRRLSSLPPLLITVDCGISSLPKLAEFRRQGGQVIVTDHHLPPKADLRPKAPKTRQTSLWSPPAPPPTPPMAGGVDALIHTTELSGTGVAWRLASFLLKSEADEFLELVSLATVTDCMPLTGVNRPLVTKGLKLLPQTGRIGLQELYRQAGLKSKSFSPYELGWLIGPRLNAPGRLGHALNSLKLLSTRNFQQAQHLAEKLEELNSRRQKLTRQAADQAENMLQEEKENILVAAHPEWPEGIIGLIASKLTEKYFLPALAIAQKSKISKGSARSVKGFNIVSFLRQTEDLLDSCGGHEMAAGFSLPTKNLDEFRRRVQVLGREETILKDREPQLKVDLELSLAQTNLELAQMLKQLEPHGIGNPAPVFVGRGVRAFNIRAVGSSGKHLKLTLQDAPSASAVSAIGFSLGHLSTKLRDGQLIDIAYQLTIDNYYDFPRVEVKIKDLRQTNVPA